MSDARAAQPRDAASAAATMTKAQLIARVEAWAQNHGRHWVLGGPHAWSKDELLAAVARIERGDGL